MTDDPFALTALGHTFYVVTNAKHSAEVYKNTDSLSFEEFVRSLMRLNGNDEQVIQNVYTPLPVEKLGFANPKGLSLGALVQRMHVHQLHPGDYSAVLHVKIRDWINRELTFKALAKDYGSYASQGSKSVELPLYEWTSAYLVRLGQYAYFGDVLSEVDPAYAEAYMVFDEVIWKMLYHYPSFLCRDMTGPRDRMMSSLKKYLKLPTDYRRQHAAWLLNVMEDEMKAIGVDDDNLAILIFHLHFA